MNRVDDVIVDVIVKLKEPLYRYAVYLTAGAAA
jgi:hypothetical protein